MVKHIQTEINLIKWWGKLKVHEDIAWILNVKIKEARNYIKDEKIN